MVRKLTQKEENKVSEIERIQYKGERLREFSINKNRSTSGFQQTREYISKYGTRILVGFMRKLFLEK